MPVSRRTAEGLSTEVAAAYARAEVRLLALIGRHLEAGTGAPQWAEAKLAELQTFRRRAEGIVDEATREAVAQATEAVQTAYRRGAAAGETELRDFDVDTTELAPRQAEFAVESLTRAHADMLEDMGPRIVRSATDGYRDAVVKASAGTLSGATTRVQDAQEALDLLAKQGLSGFTDKAGRRWGLESYVDMATRTTTAQAAIHGQMDRLEQGGISLYLVSNSSRECETCRKWEGKVLSRGPVTAVQRNVLTGEMERVDVDGTVDEATRAGLFHPNCTHNLSGYIHGATKRGDATGSPEGYAEKQRQRAMERKVREWKRREAAAITPEAKRKARAKVREWQGAIRDHTKATGLPRKTARESFDVSPPKMDKWTRWGAGRGVRVTGDNLPDFNPDNPLEFYGDRLNVAGRGELVEQHLSDLEQFNEGAHTALRDHFADRDGAGFYVGDTAVPDLDDLGHLRGVQPRGWDEGQSWDNVPGAYNPSTRVCACGGGGKGHGSTSLAMHEGSHALDAALGEASRSPEFIEVFHEAHGTAYLNPYFTHPANPTGYLSEGFAEGYAAYTKHRNKSREDQITGMAVALTDSEGGPKTRAVMAKLVDYFAGLV